MSLAALLVEHPFGDDEPLLHTVDHSVGAGEARRQAQAVARALRGRGVRPGQAVAVRLPNGPDVVTAMAGIWLAGAVFVPVNPRHPPAEIDKVIAAVEPVAMIDEDGVRRLAGDRTYAGDTAFVLWTSGTTGRPKPVLHTHGAYLELIDRVLAPLRAKPARPGHRPSPNLIPVSLALNAGIYNVLFGLRAGAPLVIMDGFDPAIFATLVRRFEIRSTVAPPVPLVGVNTAPFGTSVAVSVTWSPSASIRTLARIGIVFRRSTTDCACATAFRSAARSIENFMALAP